MNYQKIILVGNVIVNARLRKSSNSNVLFARFGLGVSNSSERTSFFPVVVFGQLGQTLFRQITRGRQVLVEGRIEPKEGGFDVVADRIVLGSLLVKFQPKENI